MPERQVRVEVGGREWELTLRPSAPFPHSTPRDDSWEVIASSGRHLGRVYKSSYTYSPPTHRGSRIARYHRSVPCWSYESGPTDDRERGVDRKTRKEALIGIVRDYSRRCKTQDQLHEYARAHPEAVFRLNRGRRVGGGHRGEVIHLHAGNAIYIRDKSKGAGDSDVKVRLREMENDQAPCLEVQLGKGRRFEPVVNPLYDEYGSSYVGG